MTNGDSPQHRAVEALHRVSALMDEGRMTRHIDEPIDKAVEAFVYDEDREYSHDYFHETIPNFVQYLYEKAIRLGRILSQSQAHDEAVALLERWYQGTRQNGYDGAVLDAAAPHGAGIGLVLARLAEILKARERQKYLRWIVVRHIEWADWSTRCAMARILVGRCYEVLSARIRNYPPCFFAEDVYELLILDISTTAELQRSGFSAISPEAFRFAFSCPKPPL
ncbi:hypothetical protein HQ520_00775 [bacterium]|nr:hypothetical protein [bacterium]